MIIHTAPSLESFVTMPFALHQDDDAWVPPLVSQDVKRLDVRRNRFFERADRELFLAMRGARRVGRIAAIHDRSRDDGTGIFGFFECEDDQATCGALIDAAASWLRERGLRRVIGPMNLTSFDETGVLIEGNGRRPPFMASHHPAYYRSLLEAAGFTKERDTLAFERSLVEPDGRHAAPPPGLVAAAENARQSGNYTLRTVKLSDWDEEISRVHRVLMRSFEELEGHVALSEREFAAMAKQMKSIMDPRLLLLAEHEGSVVGFAFLFPDVNEVLARIGGRMLPLGWLRAWWYSRHVETVSFKLAGVLPEHRRGGLAALLALEASLAAQRAGFRRMEMSVVLESNQRMCDFIRLQGAKPYLRYRLYGRDL